MNKEKNLDGIKGWLILVAIGIVLNPIKAVISLWDMYQQLFFSGAWEALTTQGNETYSPLLAPILSGELLICSCLTLASLYIAYMFFSKSRNFPKWFIGTAIFGMVYVAVDDVAVKMILSNMSIVDPGTTKGSSGSMFTLLIWIPYMLVSKRVNETFKR